MSGKSHPLAGHSGGLLSALAGTLTYRQVRYWHDPESFWRRALALTEDNYIAHDSLGALLHRQGRTDEAVEQFRAALAIRLTVCAPTSISAPMSSARQVCGRHRTVSNGGESRG